LLHFKNFYKLLIFHVSHKNTAHCYHSFQDFPAVLKKKVRALNKNSAFGLLNFLKHLTFLKFKVFSINSQRKRKIIVRPLKLVLNLFCVLRPNFLLFGYLQGMILQEAEQAGFTSEDIQVAVNHCGDTNPVEWLRQGQSHQMINLFTSRPFAPPFFMSVN
jgi:hypothetical protein